MMRKLVLVAANVLCAAVALGAQPEDCNTAKALCEAQASVAITGWGNAIVDEGEAVTQRSEAFAAKPYCTDPVKLKEGNDLVVDGDRDYAFGAFYFNEGDRNYTTGVLSQMSGDTAYAAENWDVAQSFYELAIIDFNFAIGYYGQASDSWIDAAGDYDDAETAYIEGTP